MTYAINATGPFYHGTRADLAPGALLAPGLCFAQLRFRLQLRRPQAVVDLLLGHARRGDLGPPSSAFAKARIGFSKTPDERVGRFDVPGPLQVHAGLLLERALHLGPVGRLRHGQEPLTRGDQRVTV